MCCWLLWIRAWLLGLVDWGWVEQAQARRYFQHDQAAALLCGQHLLGKTGKGRGLMGCFHASHTSTTILK